MFKIRHSPDKASLLKGWIELLRGLYSGRIWPNICQSLGQRWLQWDRGMTTGRTNVRNVTPFDNRALEEKKKRDLIIGGELIEDKK